MASRDLHNNVKISKAIDPAAALTANATTNSAIIDTQGFESLEFVIVSGVITDGSFTVNVQEGDAANLSDAATVAAGDLVGTLAGAAFAVTDDSVTKKIGYRGSKRYVRLQLIQAGATTGAFMSAVALQSDTRNNPVSAGAAPSP